MENPDKRLKQTILVAVATLLLYSVIMLYIGHHHYNTVTKRDSKSKMETVYSLIEGYDRTADEIGEVFCETVNAEVRLMTIKLAGQVKNGVFSGDRFGEKSMVVRVRGGKVELPSEAAGLFSSLTPEMIINEYVCQETEDVLLVSGRIAGDWYFVKWTPMEEYRAYITSNLPEEKLLETLKTDSALTIFSDETVFSAEDLEKDSFTKQMDDGKKYLCFPARIETLGHTFVCAYPAEGERVAFLSDIITQIVLVAIMLAGLITWCYSLLWMVRNEELDDKRREKYRPEEVKKKTTRLAVTSTVILAAFVFLTVMIQYMSQENGIAENLLTMFRLQLEEAEQNDAVSFDQETEKYEQLGKIIPAMLSEDPTLLKREKLAEIAEAISADYIIVFDENGAETACSREYIAFALPTDEEDPFTDFRRLLKGVSSVSHELDEDMITGETRSFIGFRYDLPEGSGRFGAVLIALPSREASSAEENEDAVKKVKQLVYSSVRDEERMIMEIDPETHMILSCSKNAYVGSDATSLGLNPGRLSDRHMGFYYLDDEWYYAIAKATGSGLYCYFTDSGEMSRTGLLFALLSGALFLIAYAVTAKLALRDYSDENYERNANVQVEPSKRDKRKKSKAGSSVAPVIGLWRSLTPEQKTKSVLQVEAGILLVIMTLIAIGNSPLSRHSALHFVIKGNWTRGVNLLSVIAVVVTGCVGYLIYLVLKLIFNFLYGITDPEGVTVLKLICSCLNYLVFIGTVCVSLSFFGVDTVTLLASLGLFSLAISLGAKDIVTDILAGLSIVFEKTYKVGDVIKIGDFKGKVVETGVRSTKIVNGDHDVKTIYNHEIGNVINYSAQNTVCVVKIALPVTISVSELRDVFEKELPLVRNINPHIVKGPKFEGILEFKDNNMIIGVSAEGPEEYISGIKVDLNTALQSMAERKLLTYANPNITINVHNGSVTTGDEPPVEDKAEDRSSDRKEEKHRRRGTIRGYRKG